MTAATSNAIVVAVSASGLTVGRRIADGLGATLEGREVLADTRIEAAAPRLRQHFEAGTPLVVIGAVGIVVRVLGPLTAEKREEPPVVVVSEDGSAVIPTLGGHRGANALATEIGALLDVAPAITTATDLAFGVALDDPPAGWNLADPEHYGPFAARLLAGDTVRIGDGLPWLEGAPLPIAKDGTSAPLEILATDAARPARPDRLVYHTETLAVGVGCERDTPPDAVLELVLETLDAAGLAPASVACVVSIDVKADEPAVHAVAAALGCPARFFTAERLEAETPRLATPSDLVFKEVGCHGVSEGAALAAAGDTGVLVVPKRVKGRATCAIARAPHPIDARSVGRARGHLTLVGIGPGDDALRLPAADAALAEVDAVVGYGLYLDLLGPVIAHAERFDLPLGKEADRARLALDLAAEGRRVALVSSGDIGIYAMATLVFEVLDREPDPRHTRVEIETIPGVSAMQVCAARIGAPLGHDFCAVSLSDLLTPWEAIERRLEAAAAADFVISLYNPVSLRRRTQIARAREILLASRPADTPVVLGRELGRPGESVEVITLGELGPDLPPERLDMLTVVVIGATSSRTVSHGGGTRLYTPRGYSVGADTPLRKAGT